MVGSWGMSVKSTIDSSLKASLPAGLYAAIRSSGKEIIQYRLPSWVGQVPVARAGRTLYRRWVSSRRARRDPAEQWLKGVNEEIGFWEHWLDRKDAPDYAERVNPSGRLLDDLVVRRLPPDRSYIRILDVGSGPVSSLGFPRSPDGRQIELTAADPLASSYKELLHRYGIDPPAWPIPVAAEELSTRFGDGVFDLVYCANALDHSANPLLGIRQMLRVVRPGCYVILTHEPNVAESEAYAGLHGWSFDEREGRFIIRRGFRETDIGQILGKNAEVSVCRTPVPLLDGLWICASIRRLPELHGDLAVTN
jgi:SAM-dependent methyltransferase